MSALCALSNLHPEAKFVWQWLKHGWHVAVAYIIGFAPMLAVLGWHPDAPHQAVTRRRGRGEDVPTSAAIAERGRR
jgi:hypothetical protein